MPFVMGAGVSYSPLLYRPREQWGAIGKHLRGSAIQPRQAARETADDLNDYARRIDAGMVALERAIADQSPDVLIVLIADRGSHFDASHVPQIHMQVGGEIWGNPALAELGEEPCRLTFKCDEAIAGLLIEELVRDGFDIAEAKGRFEPVGNPEVGIAPSAAEALARLAPDIPVIPISQNCHVAPLSSGRRVASFGMSLARAARMTDKRIGLLLTGGLSGDPRGQMAGWIDDVFDRWVLDRLARGNAADLARVWDVPSRNLLVGTNEVRLWTAGAATMEAAELTATIHDYMPIYQAACGVGFVTWEV